MATATITNLTATAQSDGNIGRRKTTDRRQVERREPKRGVNVRHDDRDGYKPKRVRRGEVK